MDYLLIVDDEVSHFCMCYVFQSQYIFVRHAKKLRAGFIFKAYEVLSKIKGFRPKTIFGDPSIFLNYEFQT